ncbi:MAG TPA: fumarylacetoacetate hydrolase family protein, partial [Bacillota bacterium]|nr:fumarylacetoacetate hydrolase family protein [Bacillota bacterium]
ARVAAYGVIHDATEKDGGLLLDDGRWVKKNDVVWLPPIEPQTIFVLGLNYQDHVSEIAVNRPDEPLVFLKGPNALIGHDGQTKRPEGIVNMHYECELAVIIGRNGRNIKKEEAYTYVGGYTVANDYTIRDYLENYYRPNLRVKNRDTLTPIGPWFVPADMVSDPMQLVLKTYVNGKLEQNGSTRDMIFDIPSLIAYLSSFMTLNKNDIVLTGTPKGTIPVYEGDEILTEIEGIGSLKSTIVGEKAFKQRNKE